jgi:hypothetical protein
MKKLEEEGAGSFLYTKKQAIKFEPDAIFYDFSRQAHYKLKKKKDKTDEWEGEKIKMGSGDPKSKKNVQGEIHTVNETNLKKYINIKIQGVFEND